MFSSSKNESKQWMLHVLWICAIEQIRRMCWVGHSAEQFAVINFAIHSISWERRGLNPGSADKTLNMKIRHGRMGTTRSGACGLIWLNTRELPRMWHSKDWQIDSSLLIQWIAWCMTVLSWWSHLSGSCRLCVRSERERKRKRENEKERKWKWKWKENDHENENHEKKKKTDWRKNNHTQEKAKLA